MNYNLIGLRLSKFKWKVDKKEKTILRKDGHFNMC